MLCDKLTSQEARILALEGSKWVVERKLDGIRAVIEGGKLFDRRGKEITALFPEFIGLSTIQEVVDGEIIANTGEFNDISGRMHMKDKFQIGLCAKMNPATFVAFDIVRSGDLIARKYELHMKFFPIGVPKFDWMQLVVSFSSFEDGWDKVQEYGWEGVILKDRHSTYQQGVRSKDWLKVKNFEETIAEFTKLEIHPRGVRLETAAGRSVNVNGAQAKDVIAQFKLHGKVSGEIQFLPQRGSTAWRFPSWRGMV